MGDESVQAGLDVAHAPEGEKATQRALFQLVAEVEIRARQPVLGFVPKSQAAVQQDIRGHL